jgi:hypothetical protein
MQHGIRWDAVPAQQKQQGRLGQHQADKQQQQQNIASGL